eukprot:354727-Chlamydomonas_euryale.AAC.7
MSHAPAAVGNLPSAAARGVRARRGFVARADRFPVAAASLQTELHGSGCARRGMRERMPFRQRAVPWLRTCTSVTHEPVTACARHPTTRRRSRGGAADVAGRCESRPACLRGRRPVGLRAPRCTTARSRRTLVARRCDPPGKPVPAGSLTAAATAAAEAAAAASCDDMILDMQHMLVSGSPEPRSRASARRRGGGEGPKPAASPVATAFQETSVGSIFEVHGEVATGGAFLFMPPALRARLVEEPDRNAPTRGAWCADHKDGVEAACHCPELSRDAAAPPRPLDPPCARAECDGGGRAAKSPPASLSPRWASLDSLRGTLLRPSCDGDTASPFVSPWRDADAAFPAGYASRWAWQPGTAGPSPLLLHPPCADREFACYVSNKCMAAW